MASGGANDDLPQTEEIRTVPSRSRLWDRVRSRSNTANSASRPSSRSRSGSRNRSTSRSSRPQSPHSHLHRIYSAHHLNDTGVYIDEHHDRNNREPSTKPSRVSLNKENPTNTTAIKTADKTPNKETEDASGVSDSDEREDHESEVVEVRDGIADEHDVEKGDASLEHKQSSESIASKKQKDPNLVTWEGEDDPENPKNWTIGHKWIATVVVSSFTFISPVSSSMVAPALTVMARDLHVNSEVESAMMLSIFILAYAVGPLFLGPLSEMYGRVKVLQLANLFYFVWNLACGFAKTGPQMFVFRFLSGIGGSAPLAVGGGVLADCWRAEQRGAAISAYSLAPLIGPAVGPIAGGFIAQNTTWRWVFWSTCIADICIQISGLFLLQETYAPILLHRKMLRLQKETGNDKLHTEFHDASLTIWKKLRVSLVRPFRLLGTQPIVQVLALYMALLYGVVYLVLSTFPALWTDTYHESVQIGGLNYISLGLGCFLGAQITAPFNDRIYRKLKKSHNNVGQPEFRCPVMVPGALMVPIGLFIYGWSAQYKVFWLVPNIGVFILSAGTIICFQAIQSYLVDSYTTFAASAVAAATVLRSLAGFGFPLFAPAMYASLTFGWGNSLLGFVSIVLGCPAPFLLWKYGPLLRSKSQFAAGGE